jgi:hypothetical protein
MWHTPRGRERSSAVSSLNRRRKFRAVKLLLVGAFVAIRLVVPGASKAQDVSWASHTQAADAATGMSPHADALGAIRPGVTLGGFTSQGWPFVLELSRSGKLTIEAATGLDMTCTSGAQFAVEDAWQLLGIAKNGMVRTTQQIPPAGAILTGGSHSLTGRFDRKRLTFRGAWSLQLNFKFADGTTDTCQSGTVKLIARL